MPARYLIDLVSHGRTLRHDERRSLGTVRKIFRFVERTLTMAIPEQMTPKEWKVWRQRRELYTHDPDEQALYDARGCMSACSHAKRIEMLTYLCREFEIDPLDLNP